MKKLLEALTCVLLLAPWAAAAPVKAEEAVLQSSWVSEPADNGLLDLLRAATLAKDSVGVAGVVSEYGGQMWCNTLSPGYCTYRWDTVEGCCVVTSAVPGVLCEDRCL